MRRKNKLELPKGYRIERLKLKNGNWQDPYDLGTYTYQLEVYETRWTGHLWWRKLSTAWWPVERNDKYGTLVRSAETRAGKR
jgi:hypothetical protein